MKVLKILTICLIFLFNLTNCSRKVIRIDPSEIKDISGRWNDTDSRITADKIVEDVINGSWITDHQLKNNGKKPVVIVGEIFSNSHEHIDSEIFIKCIEKAFVRTGKVSLVEGGKKRESLRRERADQTYYSSDSTAKKWNQETAADYMLQGSINSIVDNYKKRKTVFYKISLQLTQLEKNEVVWMEDKEIKKFIKN